MPSTPRGQACKTASLVKETPSKILKENISEIIGFELGDQIGSGTQGVVYKATITVLINGEAKTFPVAVKYSFSDKRATDETSLLEEITAEQCSSVESGVANFIGTIPLENDDGTIDTVDCYPLGIGTLENYKEFIAKLYTNPTGETDVNLHQQLILNYIDFVIRALKTLGRYNAVHCDPKPENIVFHYNPNLGAEYSGLMLIDFDCARTSGKIKGLVGTPLYISPEAANTEPLCIAEKTDTFSFGLILQELLGIPITEKNNQLSVCYERGTSAGKKIECTESGEFYSRVIALINGMTDYNLESRYCLAQIITAYEDLKKHISSGNTISRSDINMFYHINRSSAQTAVKPAIKPPNPDVNSLADMQSSISSTNSARLFGSDMRINTVGSGTKTFSSMNESKSALSF